jgi:hypothetical protein
MKKIFVRGPVLSATGYGEQSRFALRALRSRPDLFDVYIQPIPWGKSGWIWQDNELRQWMDEKIKTTQLLLSEKVLAPDISLQITIPNEFEKMCPINIGYTAGIETTKVSAKWLQKGNEMDKILVVSNHGKDTYVNTKIPLNDGREYKLNTPVDVVWECTPNPDEAESIEGFNPRHDFNFLVVSQFGPRKNFANTITWFVEKFQNEDVGLILKTHNKGASIIDLDNVEKSLAAVLEPFPNRKCSVSLLHGDLSEAQMKGLYEHDKVKCLINIAHGEGFGLPLSSKLRELAFRLQQFHGLVNLTSFSGMAKTFSMQLIVLSNQFLKKQFGMALSNVTLNGLMQIRMLIKHVLNTSLITTRIVLRALLSFKVRCWSTSVPKGFTSYSATL